YHPERQTNRYQVVKYHWAGDSVANLGRARFDSTRAVIALARLAGGRQCNLRLSRVTKAVLQSARERCSCSLGLGRSLTRISDHKAALATFSRLPLVCTLTR